MKFTYAMMAFLLWFSLGSVTFGQTNFEAANDEAASTMSLAETQHARLFKVTTNTASTQLNVEFDMREDLLTSIEVVPSNGGSAKILDEQVFDQGLHNRYYDISNLMDGEYYCVIRTTGWVGAYAFEVETPLPVVGSIFF